MTPHWKNAMRRAAIAADEADRTRNAAREQERADAAQELERRASELPWKCERCFRRRVVTAPTMALVPRTGLDPAILQRVRRDFFGLQHVGEFTVLRCQPCYEETTVRGHSHQGLVKDFEWRAFDDHVKRLLEVEETMQS